MEELMWFVLVAVFAAAGGTVVVMSATIAADDFRPRRPRRSIDGWHYPRGAVEQADGDRREWRPGEAVGPWYGNRDPRPVRLASHRDPRPHRVSPGLPRAVVLVIAALVMIVIAVFVMTVTHH